MSCKVQITFPTSQTLTSATPKLEKPDSYLALPDINVIKEKPPSSDLSKIYNPILKSSSATPQNGNGTPTASSVQTSAVVTPVTLNPSASAVIPKAILGSLQVRETDSGDQPS